MANNRSHSKNKHLSLILRISIACIACWIIYKKIEIDQLSEAFTQIHFLTLLLAILFFCTALCLIGLRWWVFMRAQNIYIPILLAIKLTFLGQFFTNFMPSAVGGDLVRAWYISRHTPDRLKAAIGVAADRFMGLSATLVLAVSSYLVFMRDQEGVFQISKKDGAIALFFKNHSISVYHILLCMLILIGCLFLLSNFIDLSKIIKKLIGVGFHLFQQTSRVFIIYIHHPLILLFGLTISIFMQSLIIFSFWLIGRDLDISAQMHHYFVFFPMIWVISSIPISIAGIGILEGGLVFLFVQFAGASAESVMALALCQRLAWIIGSVPGMVVHLTGTAQNRNKEGQC